jgi:hypothetical protein
MEFIRAKDQRTEHVVDIPTAPRQTPTKRALGTKGYWGWESRVGGLNLPEGELVGFFHLIWLYGERIRPRARLC